MKKFYREEFFLDLIHFSCAEITNWGNPKGFSWIFAGILLDFEVFLQFFVAQRLYVFIGLFQPFLPTYTWKMT